MKQETTTGVLPRLKNTISVIMLKSYLISRFKCHICPFTKSVFRNRSNIFLDNDKKKVSLRGLGAQT